MVKEQIPSGGPFGGVPGRLGSRRLGAHAREKIHANSAPPPVIPPLVLESIGIPFAQKRGRGPGWIRLAVIALVSRVASFLYRRSSIRWVYASTTSHGASRRRAPRCTAKLHCARRPLSAVRRGRPR